MNEANTTLKSSMCMHCGANDVSLEDVYNAETPETQEVEFVVKSAELTVSEGKTHGRHKQLSKGFEDEGLAQEFARSVGGPTIIVPRRPRFQPIPHYRLIDEVKKTAKSAGLRVVDEAHAMTRDGLRYFGLLEVRNGNNPEDFGVIYGLRNSHDNAFKASVGLGSRVFVCDNLAFSAEITIGRMHTKNILRDLPGLVSQAVGQLGEARASQEQRFAAYRANKLEDLDLNDLMIRGLDARAYPVTKIPQILKEIREPSHEEFLKSGRTAWTLFNAVTETLKGGNLQDLPKRTLALQGVLDSACGVLVNLN